MRIVSLEEEETWGVGLEDEVVCMAIVMGGLALIT
jgi:hypothetical protein